MGDLTVDTYTTDDGRYRIRIEYDDDSSAANPRDWDQTAVIVGLHSRYNIGDRKPEPDEQDAIERGGWPLLKRYLQLSKHAIAICAVGMYDHSGISLYPMEIPDAFRGVDTQWDHSTAAFAYVTRESHEKNAGGDPFEWLDVEGDLTRYATNGKMQRVWANLYGEIIELDDFVQGNVFGFIVEKRVDWKRVDDEDDDEMSTWEQVESCWGFLGESEYAMAEAKATLDSILSTEKKAAVA